MRRVPRSPSRASQHADRGRGEWSSAAAKPWVIGLDWQLETLVWKTRRPKESEPFGQVRTCRVSAAPKLNPVSLSIRECDFGLLGVYFSG